MGSGGKGGGGGQAHDYFGTIAGLVCAGPVDALLGIIVDGKTVWPEADSEWQAGQGYTIGTIVHSGGRAWTCTLAHTSDSITAPGATGAPWTEYALNRTSPGVGSPATITVPGYGFAIIYWGTADQNHGPDTPAEIVANHPPYRGQCWFVLKDWLFGRERVSAPNVEVLVRRAPVQSVVTGAAAALDSGGQVNPVAFAAEVLSDPIFGAGAPELIDGDSWQETADKIQERPDLWNISPVLRDAKPFNAVAELLGGYVPIFQRRRGDGRIALGTFPMFEEPPDLDGQTVDEFSLSEPPSFTTEGLPPNEVSVRYLDRGRAFKDRVQKASDTLSRGETRAEAVTLDRPWITRPEQAAFAAADFLRRNLDPVAKGSIVCLRERAPWMESGALFRLRDEQSGLNVICRCVSVSAAEPPSSRLMVTFEAEPGFSPLPALEASQGGTPENPPDPETISNFQMVQPPPGLAGGNKFALLLLAARTSKVTTGIRVWMQESDPSLFTELGVQGTFAIHGTLVGTYLSAAGSNANPPDDNSESLRISAHASTPATDLSVLAETQSADAIGDARLLLWVFKAADPRQFEVMTVRAARIAAGETFYRFKVRRARFGTKRLTFGSGDRAFIVRRANLVPYFHRLFGAYGVTGAPATFRFQSSNPWRQADLTDTTSCPDHSFTFADPYAPYATWSRIETRATSGAVWADVSSFSGLFPVGSGFRLSCTLTDPNGDLTGAILRSIGPDAAEATLFSGTESGASSELQVEFTLAEGDWQIVLRVLDRTGRRRDVVLTDVGGSSPVTLKVRDVASTVVANPVASPRGGSVFADPVVALTSSTSGASIEYQVVALGAGVGSSWTAYASPVTVSGDSTLYARAKKAGMTDSPIIRHDYRYLDPETVE